MKIPLPYTIERAIVEAPYTPNWLYHRVKGPPPFDRAWVSAAVLKMPIMAGGTLSRGALVLNHVDAVVKILPALRKLFFLIERRGWWGINDSQHADVKLVEDGSTMEVTRRRYPRAILLDLSGADFVDEQAFRPLGIPPDFDVIQISCWSRRKRIELMLDAAARLPEIRFVHLGHLEDRGSADELAYRDECLRAAERSGANVCFPFGQALHADDLPTTKEQINHWINRARIGLLTTTLEGRNRFKMECMCADRPVLMPSDTAVPTKKFIASESGRFYEPTGPALAEAIRETLAALDRFRPRDHILARAGKTNAIKQLKEALGQACERSGQGFHFDDIDWDGRNQSMCWGEDAMELLHRTVSQCEPMLNRRGRRARGR